MTSANTMIWTMIRIENENDRNDFTQKVLDDWIATHPDYKHGDPIPMPMNVDSYEVENHDCCCDCDYGDALLLTMPLCSEIGHECI